VRLLQSLNKVKKLSPGLSIDNILALANASMSRNKYKNRFVIRIGERIKTVGVEEVVAFFSQDNATYMLHKDGRRYPLDYSLDLIESMVNPDAFFRVSRKFIVSINACSDITAWSNSRLKINLPGVDDQMVVVARERVQQFKQWLDSN
jgi:DNA-binding LytR/AlgR family response regulator